MINDKITLFNDIFRFRGSHNMEQDTIFEVLLEYAAKKDLEPEWIAQELADYQCFVDIVEKDCIKHKYIRTQNKNNAISDWE